METLFLHCYEHQSRVYLLCCVCVGLSLFWLRALRASDASAAGVAHRDELALSYLTDVRVRLDWSHMPTQEEPWRKAKGKLHTDTYTRTRAHTLPNVFQVPRMLAQTPHAKQRPFHAHAQESPWTKDAVCACVCVCGCLCV